MKCPHCGHEKSRVTDTRQRPEADLRYRLCMNCGKKFTTLETVCVYAGRQAGHVSAPLPDALDFGPPLPEEPEPAPRPPVRIGRYIASLDDDRLVNVCAEAQPLLVQWWNEARFSKHKARATWTEAAWEMSVERVAALAKPQQIELAQAGVEHGWQTLKYGYLDAAKGLRPVPSAAGRPMPKDPAMLAALDQWPA